MGGGVLNILESNPSKTPSSGGGWGITIGGNRGDWRVATRQVVLGSFKSGAGKSHSDD